MGRQSSRILINGQDAKQVIACDESGKAYDIDQIWMSDKASVLSLAWEKIKSNIKFLAIDRPARFITYGSKGFLGIFGVINGEDTESRVSEDGLEYQLLSKVDYFPGWFLCFYKDAYYYDSFPIGSYNQSHLMKLYNDTWVINKPIFINPLGTVEANESVYNFKVKIINDVVIATYGQNEDTLSGYGESKYTYGLYTTTDMITFRSINMSKSLYYPNYRVYIHCYFDEIFYNNGYYYCYGGVMAEKSDGISIEYGYFKTDNFINCTLIEKISILYNERAFFDEFALFCYEYTDYEILKEKNKYYITYDLEEFIEIELKTAEFDQVTYMEKCFENDKYFGLIIHRDSADVNYSLHIIKKSDFSEKVCIKDIDGNNLTRVNYGGINQNIVSVSVETDYLNNSSYIINIDLEV